MTNETDPMDRVIKALQDAGFTDVEFRDKDANDDEILIFTMDHVNYQLRGIGFNNDTGGINAVVKDLNP